MNQRFLTSTSRTASTSGSSPVYCEQSIDQEANQYIRDSS